MGVGSPEPLEPRGPGVRGSTQHDPQALEGPERLESREPAAPDAPNPIGIGSPGTLEPRSPSAPHNLIPEAP
eukprot:9481691-Pyramimonas_sp.AAC.2